MASPTSDPEQTEPATEQQPVPPAPDAPAPGDVLRSSEN